MPYKWRFIGENHLPITNHRFSVATLDCKRVQGKYANSFKAPNNNSNSLDIINWQSKLMINLASIKSTWRFFWPTYRMSLDQESKSRTLVFFQGSWTRIFNYRILRWPSRTCGGVAFRAVSFKISHGFSSLKDRFGIFVRLLQRPHNGFRMNTDGTGFMSNPYVTVVYP